jgi:hypothetical protein
MKYSSLLFATLIHPGIALAGEPTPVPTSYPMAEAVGCKMMVRGALDPALTSLNLPKIEEVACACVDRKLRDDVVMVTLFGTDREAKKKMIGRENLQTYMIAKGMSYTFACLAPALGEAADGAFQR